MEDTVVLSAYSGNPTIASSWSSLYIAVATRVPGATSTKPVFGGAVDDATIKQVRKRIADHAAARSKSIASGDNTNSVVDDPFRGKGPTAMCFNGKSQVLPAAALAIGQYNKMDAERKKKLGNHYVKLVPRQYERLMAKYIRVTVSGGFYSVKDDTLLQTIQVDYLMVNGGTDKAPDWQAVGIMGESIHHQTELTNAGKTGLSTSEEAAYILHTVLLIVAACCVSGCIVRARERVPRRRRLVPIGLLTHRWPGRDLLLLLLLLLLRDPCRMSSMATSRRVRSKTLWKLRSRLASPLRCTTSTSGLSTQFFTRNGRSMATCCRRRTTHWWMTLASNTPRSATPSSREYPARERSPRPPLSATTSKTSW